MTDWFLVFAGLAMLLIGGDKLVSGSIVLAEKLSISRLVVSLTVVAFGTSAPELLIAVQSAMEGVPEIALGNVIGSNIANILLVLGIPAILTGLCCTDKGSKLNFLYLICATLFFIMIAYTQPLYIWQGILLLFALSIILFINYFSIKNNKTEIDKDTIEKKIETWRMIFFLIIGLVFLPLGAKFLVGGAVNISRFFGISEAIIGLTLIALGTSLPELATTVMAGYRKEGDVAFGNILGSNIFNLLAIVGIACLFGPLPIDPEFFQLDLWVMLAATLMLGFFVLIRLKMNRVWGIFFVLYYIVYIIFLLNK